MCGALATDTAMAIHTTNTAIYIQYTWLYKDLSLSARASLWCIYPPWQAHSGTVLASFPYHPVRAWVWDYLICRCSFQSRCSNNACIKVCHVWYIDLHFLFLPEKAGRVYCWHTASKAELATEWKSSAFWCHHWEKVREQWYNHFCSLIPIPPCKSMGMRLTHL